MTLLLLAASAAFAQPVPIPGDSESMLEKGVEAYRSGQFQQAIGAFQQAADFDPNDLTAHLYLATAHMVLYIPGVASPGNAAHAQQARSEFQRALVLDPNNLTALQSLASLTYLEAGSTDQPDIAKLDEARDWYQRVLGVDQSNKAVYYTLAVIDWRKSYPYLAAARSNLHMKPVDPGPLPDPAVRQSLKNTYASIIEDGIANLKKALEIDAQYADAMSYMNLLLRERADLRDSAEEYRHDIQAAGLWLQKSLDTKNMKTEQARSFTAQRIRVAPDVEAANLIKRTEPVSPEPRMQGTVRLNAVIGRDGRVQNVRFLSGQSRLAGAAAEAVKQWIYRPTLIGGQPVEVITQIDVDFPAAKQVSRPR